MRVHVEVTATDIRRGKRLDRAACPVARAVRRATGRNWKVLNSRMYCGAAEVKTPPEVEKFIYCFDMRETVQPFAFDVDLPE